VRAFDLPADVRPLREGEEPGVKVNRS